MTLLYTKNGRPLQRSGDSLYSKSGVYLGRISGDKVYDISGRYAGTIDGGRVYYRSTDGATRGTISASANMAGTAAAKHGRVCPLGRRAAVPGLNEEL